jgi:hypothetical protein
MLYMFPFGARIGYQFVLGRYQFPISLLTGGIPTVYLSQLGYFGYFFKPGASVLWRFDPDWSFGLNINWCITPQSAERFVLGNYLEITLAARYSL